MYSKAGEFVLLIISCLILFLKSTTIQQPILQKVRHTQFSLKCKYWVNVGVAVVWWSTHRLGDQEVCNSNPELGILFQEN